MDSPSTREQRVIVTGFDIPFTVCIDLAFKVTVAFLIASFVIGIPIGVVAWIILSML